MEIINSLNSYAGTITAIATVVLSIITWVYVCLTRRLVKAANEPRIEINSRLEAIKGGYRYGYLCVKNIGTGAAYDVQFDTDLSFSFGNRPSLENIGFLKRGIGCLLPAEVRESSVVKLNYVDKELIKKQLKIEVTYKDWINKKHQKCFCINFREHQGTWIEEH